MVVFVHVYLTSAADKKTAADTLILIPEIQEIHFITGNDCYLLKMRVSDINQLNEILEDRIMTIKHVRRTKTSVALSTIKETSQIPLDLTSITEPAQ